MTAELCGIPDLAFEEVDLSRGEQLSERFLAINPKHQVPAIEEDGKHMAESRDIARHLCDKYCKDPSREHWYPKDPVKRKEVDEWLDWSKPLHLAIEMGVVVEHVACQAGMGWRQNYGFIIALAGAVSRARGAAFQDLKRCIAEAEVTVGRRGKTRVEDLDLGDVATLMEVSQAMECHPTFDWSAFPNLSKLLMLMRQVPEFNSVYAPLLEFLVPLRQARACKRRATCWECVGECFTGLKTLARVAAISKRHPAKRAMHRGSTRELH